MLELRRSARRERRHGKQLGGYHGRTTELRQHRQEGRADDLQPWRQFLRSLDFSIGQFARFGELLGIALQQVAGEVHKFAQSIGLAGNRHFSG